MCPTSRVSLAPTLQRPAGPSGRQRLDSEAWERGPTANLGARRGPSTTDRAAPITDVPAIRAPMSVTRNREGRVTTLMRHSAFTAPSVCYPRLRCHSPIYLIFRFPSKAVYQCQLVSTSDGNYAALESFRITLLALPKSKAPSE